MPLSFHHLFVFCPFGAPEADALLPAGFAEGSPNTHPGQGTANRRFFFSNGMLELVWVRDPGEIQSPLTRPTHLYERSQYLQTGFSPFGIGTFGQVSIQPPFPGWSYKPNYLPPELEIWVADNGSMPHEPMLFYGNFFHDPAAGTVREPMDHSNSVRRISRIGIQMAGKNLRRSHALERFGQTTLLDFKEGPEPLAAVEFDGGAQNRELDLRPSVPLVIRY